MISHSVDAVWQEVTYLAYHLHWPLAELVALEHRDRTELVTQVDHLVERSWAEALRRG